MEENGKMNYDNLSNFDELMDDCENEKDYIKENILKIRTSHLNECSIDIQDFKEGIKSVSYLCGAITALVNAGITPTKAMDYIVDRDATEKALDFNLRMADIQNKTAIETAKMNFINHADSN